MPITAFLHTHVLVVVLFLILFTIKAVMLFLNKHAALTTLREKTKVVEMILGTLILVTGFYMAFQYNGPWPTWLIVKVVLVFAGIPLGIVGLKRSNKVLTALALIIFIYVYGVAETKALNMKPEREEEITLEEVEEPLPGMEEPAVSTSVATPADSSATNKMAGGPADEVINEVESAALANAKAIYESQCQTCHGADGKKGLSGAADLSKSRKSAAERRNIIANGKGLMPAYKGQFSDQEIDAVAAYTESLRK